MHLHTQMLKWGESFFSAKDTTRTPKTLFLVQRQFEAMVISIAKYISSCSKQLLPPIHSPPHIEMHLDYDWIGLEELRKTFDLGSSWFVMEIRIEIEIKMTWNQNWNGQIPQSTWFLIEIRIEIKTGMKIWIHRGE